MKKHIVASIIAQNQQELNERIAKVKRHMKVMQLDIMDGKFVKNKSLWFNFKIPKTNTTYEAHLMIKQPKQWIEKNCRRFETIVFHIEATKNPKEIINLIKKKKRKAGIAINPKTAIKHIKPYLNEIDQVTIMTVTPGRYGAKFLEKPLKKIKQIKKINPNIIIEIDGGINDKTIKKVNKLEIEKYISGSYLQQSGSVQKHLKVLKDSIK